MASSTGINRRTGKPLTDWQHVVQSIEVILSTRIGTRVMRRDFGSDVPNLIDRPGTQDMVVDVVIAAAEAIDKWEPRFSLKTVTIVGAGPDGIFTLALSGRYYPRGHVGDFTKFEDAQGVEVRIR